MKLLVVATLALSALAKADGDWSKLKPRNAYAIPKKLAPHMPRVVGGGEAIPHSFPHQVGLIILDDSTLCGGSIITENVVLTAAHCCDGVKEMLAIIGAHYLFETEGTQQRMKTSTFIIHEGYNATVLKNDVCLVILPSKIILEDETAQIIRLHEGPCPDSSLVDLNATLSGWGQTSDTAGYNRVLEYATEVIISNEECRETYNIAEETNVCLYGGNYKGSCFGDSGGALIMEFDDGVEQVGVVSFGSVYGCAKGYPTAYSRITCFRDWIYDNLLLQPDV